MHADTLKEGLNFLKTQGFDVIQKISQLQKDSPLHEKIQEDFSKILGVDVDKDSGTF